MSVSFSNLLKSLWGINPNDSELINLCAVATLAQDFFSEVADRKEFSRREIFFGKKTNARFVIEKALSG